MLERNGDERNMAASVYTYSTSNDRLPVQFNTLK